jgi:hypothetical protein
VTVSAWAGLLAGRPMATAPRTAVTTATIRVRSTLGDRHHARGS